MLNWHPVLWKNAPRSLFVPHQWCERCSCMVSKWHEHHSPERKGAASGRLIIKASDTDGVGLSDGAFRDTPKSPAISGG